MDFFRAEKQNYYQYICGFLTIKRAPSKRQKKRKKVITACNCLLHRSLTAYIMFFAFRHIDITIKMLFVLWPEIKTKERKKETSTISTFFDALVSIFAVFYEHWAHFSLDFFFFFWSEKWNTGNVHLSIAFNQLLLFSVALYTQRATSIQAFK